jgi:hypothetical protein
MDINWSDPQTFWVNIMNASLGIVTLVALLALVGAAAADVYEKMTKRSAAQEEDAPAYSGVRAPELTLTASNGGAPVKERTLAGG